MTILVAHSTTPESAAALEAAYREAERRPGEPIVVFLLDGDAPDVSEAAARGLTVTIERPKEFEKTRWGASSTPRRRWTHPSS